ncbi:hypothetical protein PR202_ga21282 [Eleusine coracana subsp. coracana]|uniref:ubiquitinyl hydrolase 1 n=1 Tax=Eleusine coracana subsp. coracana TaxID=191504 RepID=A0AAV5D0Z6_ELECO|nr:hypothetical protein PR202_ga21282 [Eleusine coracana subsp. coracana]
MEDEAGEASSAASVWLAVVLLALALGMLVRGRWRRAAARREEVPEAPVWGPTPSEAAPSPAHEELEAQVPAGAKGVCAVCFRPTTFRCKQCKAVKYCSFKCQIAHWRQGHKDDCPPPSVNTKSDDGGDIEDGRTLVGNVLVGAKPNDVRSETSSANHNLPTLNETDKHIHLEETGSNIKPANIDECGATTEALDETLLCNSQAPTRKINCRNAFGSEKSSDRRAQNGSVVEKCSQMSHDRKIADNNKPQADASVHVLPPGNPKTPIRVEVEKSKTKPVGVDSIQNTKPMPSVSMVDKISSVVGGCSLTPNHSRVDNVSEISSKTSARAGKAANNLATSVKKTVKQQTVPKVVRHYPSESLYDKVDLHPFGLRNLGNSCYANAVLQCLMFTRPLTSYLLGRLHSKNCSRKEWCFMCEFEKLVVEGKQAKTALSPTGILSHLHDIGSSFGPGKQEDAHEFLRYAIEAMQSVCLKEARKGGAHQLAEETTLVQLIFGGYLRSKIRCSRCHVSSEQSERILDLTVEIDGDISSLEEALERCKSYERAKKKLTISEAPNVLTIALKRYQSGKFGKISKAIRFPETLNLACYMSANNDYSPVYSLYAVVVHQDVMNAAFSGHYVCYVKDTQGKWYKADDSQVKPTSLENVMSKCAYMLLYARCSPRAPSSVRQAMMVQDPVRVKKGKSKVISEGTTLHGGSLSRHQGVQLQMTNDLSHTFDDYGTYPPAESPSPSESSSLFSNSDAGSHSTVSTDSSDSTRNSTSTEEYEYLIFGTADQMYPGPISVSEENDYMAYSRSRSCLNTSSSGREVGDAERYTEHRLQGTRGGWVEGDEGSSFLYTDRSRQHLSSKLTGQYRQLDGTEQAPWERSRRLWSALRPQLPARPLAGVGCPGFGNNGPCRVKLPSAPSFALTSA